MRMLKCYDCGEIFSEDEADTKSENVGEFWGAPAYMDYNACPRCGSTEIDEYRTPDGEEGDEE